MEEGEAAKFDSWSLFQRTVVASQGWEGYCSGLV